MGYGVPAERAGWREVSAARPVHAPRGVLRQEVVLYVSSRCTSSEGARRRDQVALAPFFGLPFQATALR